MVTYHCDGCGRELAKNALRYTVRIDVRAAYDTLEVGLVELLRDHREEIERLIERLRGKSADDLEQSIYKSIQLDLCPACQRAYVNDPLRFHPEQGIREEGMDIDIDGFLRSLGYGKGSVESGDLGEPK